MTITSNEIIEYVDISNKRDSARCQMLMYKMLVMIRTQLMMMMKPSYIPCRQRESDARGSVYKIDEYH